MAHLYQCCAPQASAHGNSRHHYPISNKNHEKWVTKEAERRKNGWKDVERGWGAVLNLSRFSNLARFGFLYRLKPIFDPISNPFLPLSKPVPGLSCMVHLSYLDTCHLQPNHWTTSDHHQSVDQWDVCICGEETLGTSLCDRSTPSRGSKQSNAVRKARVQGAQHVKKKRRLNAPDEKRGRGRGGETQSQPPVAAASREALLKWYGRSPPAKFRCDAVGRSRQGRLLRCGGPSQSKESHVDIAAIASEPSRMHTRTVKWTNVQNHRILAWRSPPNGDRRCPSHLSHHCRSNVRGTSLYSSL